MKKDDFLKIVRSKAKEALTEQEENYFGSIGQAVEEAFTAEAVERNKKLGDITTLLGTFEEGQTAAGVIRALAKKVDDFEAQAKRGLSSDDRFKLRSILEAKKDDIIRAKETGTPWQIEFKAKRGASALMTTATILAGAGAINTTSVMDDLEILVIQYPKAFIVDAIGGRQVAKVPAVLRWKEQNTESTDAVGLTTEGSVKVLTDKSFVWKTANRAKYAGRIEFTEELAMDFDQLLLQIIDMFEQQVIRSWNTAVQVLIVAWASSYTSTEFDGTFVVPQNKHVIEALKLWVENNGYEPDILLIRPGDAALARFIQNNTGDVQFLPDNVAFSGLTVVASTNIPAGYMAIGDSRIIKEQHSNFILRRGQHGDQFIENEETIVGEVFSLLKLPTVSKGGWVYAEIAAIKSALAGGGA
jgi:hypothetical protein